MRALNTIVSHRCKDRDVSFLATLLIGIGKERTGLPPPRFMEAVVESRDPPNTFAHTHNVSHNSVLQHRLLFDGYAVEAPTIVKRAQMVFEPPAPATHEVCVLPLAQARRLTATLPPPMAFAFTGPSS